MRILSNKAAVASPALVVGLVLSGCGSSSGLEVARDVGESLLVDVAASAVADCTDFSQPNNDSICRDKEETVVKLGQSLYSELRPSPERPGAKELSEEFNTFIEERRAPAHDNGDVTNGTSSPQ